MINKIKPSQSDAHSLNPQSSILNPFRDLKEPEPLSTRSTQRRTKRLNPAERPIEEVVIENLSHEGRGVAHSNGKIVFIDNALPQEKVRFQFTRTHGSHDEGKAIDILLASPDRVEPPCPYHAICGGCSLQHLNPLAQLRHKEAILLEQLKHFGQTQPGQVLDPIMGPTLEYRFKARLGARYVHKKNKLVIGFREKNGRYITDIQQCLVLHPAVGRKINALQILLNAFEHAEQIPQIEVASGDTETALVIRHLEPLSPEEMQSLIKFSEAENLSVYLQPNKLSSIYKLHPTDQKNELSYSLPDHSITLHFHPSDFTQVNPFVNRQMILRAIEWLAIQPEDNILDLFCGIGNFSLPMAKNCRLVEGVEGDLALVERARKNAKLNLLSNVNFFTSNLVEPVKSQPWFHHPFNKLLLDPPRSGALEIIQQLAHHQFDRIVYVSCNPASFARDAGELVHRQHYRLQQVCVMDMFPHTTHVESMGLFIRGKK